MELGDLDDLIDYEVADKAIPSISYVLFDRNDVLALRHSAQAGRLPEDALFQFQFDLPSGATAKPHQLELGVHEQWCEAANVPGQYWSGFHIIDIGPEDYNVLYDWVMSPGGQLA